MFKRTFVVVLCLLFVVDPLFAQRGGSSSSSSRGGSSFSSSSSSSSSSSRGSFSSSSSGKSSFSSPSSSGRGSFSSPSTSSGKSSLGSSSNGSKGSFSSPSTSKGTGAQNPFSSPSVGKNNSSPQAKTPSTSHGDSTQGKTNPFSSPSTPSSDLKKSNNNPFSSPSTGKSALKNTDVESKNSKIITDKPIDGKTPSSVSKRPAASNFDKLAQEDSKKAESRANYEKSHAPASTYKTPAGIEKKLDVKDKEISYLRGRLDQQKWENRHQRESGCYNSYYSRPIVVYNDCYHPYFNYWLMDRSIDVMAMMIYHHQLSMDQARINAMYAQNANLQARVLELERQKTARNPNWYPADVEPDLFYNDNYVNAVYNPVPKTVTVYEYDRIHSSAVGWFFLWIFVILPLTELMVYVIYHFTFVHRYDC